MINPDCRTACVCLNHRLITSPHKTAFILEDAFTIFSGLSPLEPDLYTEEIYQHNLICTQIRGNKSKKKRRKLSHLDIWDMHVTKKSPKDTTEWKRGFFCLFFCRPSKPGLTHIKSESHSQHIHFLPPSKPAANTVFLLKRYFFSRVQRGRNPLNPSG